MYGKLGIKKGKVRNGFALVKRRGKHDRSDHLLALSEESWICFMGKKNSVKDKKCCGCGTFKIIYGDKKRFYCENCVSVVGEFQSNLAKSGD